MMKAPTALITGGEGSLAAALATELRSSGYQVLTPGRGELDVTSAETVKTYFQPLSQLDLLINQAGIIRDASLLKLSHEDFDAVVDVNLRGAARCTQAALRLMTKQRHGHIINIGSYSALSGPIGQSAYAAAKAGLIALTQSTALEYGGRNIRANCVLPGFLETRMTQPLLKDAAFHAELLRQHTLGRLNTADQVAKFITHLHTMLHVSGQIFQLDSRIHRWT
jgi:3-oxoacyl-[acyl-carrier protein] reductase